MAQKSTALERRQNRVRRKIRVQRGNGNERLRMTIHRSGKHMSVQIIDDAKGVTLAAASTMEKSLRDTSGANKDAAQKIGQLIAERAKAAGVSSVVFDRGRFAYQGRVETLAQAARDAGMQF